MSTVLLLQLAFLTFILESCSCQPLGDISLRCPGNPSLPSTGGYVTVYQPSVLQYVPVCLSGFNRAAAAAVCRQIGYVDAMPVFPGRSYFGDPSALECSTEFYQNDTRRLSHALCSNVGNYTLNGELHIMRCSVGLVINTSCPLVAVECSNTQLQDAPGYTYNGQVYLHGAFHEGYKGSLRVRLSDEYHAVCVNGFNTQAAISVCRQLGYSNGTYHAGERATGIELNNMLCNANTGSFPCFSTCIIDTGDNSSSNQGCYEVFIDCDFQIDDSLSQSAGSWVQCKLPDMNSTFDYKIAFIVVSVILGILLTAVLLLISILCVYCVYYNYKNSRATENPIDLKKISCNTNSGSFLGLSHCIIMVAIILDLRS